MFWMRVHRHATAWAALLALLFGALAPTVAQAMASGSHPADWQQVCGVSGMVWVKANTGEVSQQQPDGGGPAGDASQPCPWCTLHGGAAGLPVAHGVPEQPQRLSDFSPARYRAPLADTVWAPAQSRAPPVAA